MTYMLYLAFSFLYIEFYRLQFPREPFILGKLERLDLNVQFLEFLTELYTLGRGGWTRHHIPCWTSHVGTRQVNNPV